jgi:predicted small integral membrane protein
MVKVPPDLGVTVVAVGLEVVVVGEAGVVAVGEVVLVAVVVVGAVVVGVVGDAGLLHPRRMKETIRKKARGIVNFFIRVSSLYLFLRSIIFLIINPNFFTKYLLTSDPGHLSSRRPPC